MLPSRVATASLSPSAKYSWSGEPRFSKGSTASILRPARATGSAPLALLLGHAWRGRAPLTLLAQLLDQRQHGGIRRGAHFLLQERFVRASVLDRCSGLARGHERAHEAERGVGAERVERR